QQHHMTFTERLAPFPITVHQLSRFCTDEEITRTLAGLRSGAVDIVIGTHRLLQRDVEFRNLGLVIIDEEQRFGVLQKERFKELRVAVDVLSLSATPIPRTLHMSLAGIRDLSVIQTPPEERQPIKTYVTAREDSTYRTPTRSSSAMRSVSAWPSSTSCAAVWAAPDSGRTRTSCIHRCGPSARRQTNAST